MCRFHTTTTFSTLPHIVSLRTSYCRPPLPRHSGRRQVHDDHFHHRNHHNHRAAHARMARPCRPLSQLPTPLQLPRPKRTTLTAVPLPSSACPHSVAASSSSRRLRRILPKHAPSGSIAFLGACFLLFFLRRLLRSLHTEVAGVIRKAVLHSQSCRNSLETPGRPGSSIFHCPGRHQLLRFTPCFGASRVPLVWNAFLVPFLRSAILMRGAWPFLVIAIVFALIGRSPGALGAMLGDLLRYGTVFLAYDISPPYFPRRHPCAAPAFVPRAHPPPSIPFLTLSCVQELYVTSALQQPSPLQFVCYDSTKTSLLSLTTVSPISFVGAKVRRFLWPPTLHLRSPTLLPLLASRAKAKPRRRLPGFLPRSRLQEALIISPLLSVPPRIQDRDRNPPRHHSSILL